jgi:hypothetical protein
LGFLSLVVLPRQNSPENLIESEDITSPAELGQTLYAAHLARVGMIEAIAIFGLILFLLNENFSISAFSRAVKSISI